jgi:hypothetical protein
MLLGPRATWSQHCCSQRSACRCAPAFSHRLIKSRCLLQCVVGGGQVSSTHPSWDCCAHADLELDSRVCCCCCDCGCVLQTSVVSLGNTKQPLPGFQSRGSLLAARHGELNSNVSLAAGMPEVRGAQWGVTGNSIARNTGFANDESTYCVCLPTA